jgi:hypothetical protein
MVQLVAALLLGLAQAVPAWGGLTPWWPVYIHLLVLGWATQMIFGVAWWMFPREGPLDLTRVPWLGWICFWSLNAGMVLRALGEPALARSHSPGVVSVVIAAAALQLLSVVTFVMLTWRRVRTR